MKKSLIGFPLTLEFNCAHIDVSNLLLGPYIWLKERLWIMCDKERPGSWQLEWLIDNWCGMEDMWRFQSHPKLWRKLICVHFIYRSRLLWLRDLCLLCVIDVLLCISLSIVSARGSAYTRIRHETELFEQQDPRLQVDPEGDAHAPHHPFQPDEGSPHGGGWRQAVQKVVSRSAQPSLRLCVGQDWCLQSEGLWLVWSFW